MPLRPSLSSRIMIYKACVLNFSWQVVCENLPANFLFCDFGIYIGLVFNVKHKVDY
jgi:hypothetical protein